jgi:hypothetical protein
LRLSAVLAGLTVLGVALPTLATTEKKCCDVRVRDLAGTLTAGGEPVSVTATLAARRKGCTKVRPRIEVSLPGLEPGEIRIERVTVGRTVSLPVSRAGGGAVQAPDVVSGGLRLCGDGRANLVYRLALLDSAPAGRATLSAEADTVAGKVLGRDATVTVVLAPAAAPPAKREGRPERAAPTAPRAAPTAPRAAPTSAVDSPLATEPTPATAPADAQPAAKSDPATRAPFSSAAIVSGLGTVVALAFGLVGFLALRQRRREGPATGSDETAGSSQPTGPLHLDQQPTLAARWSSLVAGVRRASGTVSLRRPSGTAGLGRPSGISGAGQPSSTASGGS